MSNDVAAPEYFATYFSVYDDARATESFGTLFDLYRSLRALPTYVDGFGGDRETGFIFTMEGVNEIEYAQVFREYIRTLDIDLAGISWLSPVSLNRNHESWMSEKQVALINRAKEVIANLDK